MRAKRFWRAVAALALLAASPTLLVLWRWEAGNFGVVEPGAIYRSAQLSHGGLMGSIRDRGIRSVVNLRGPNDDAAWYLAERRATTAAGSTLIDLSMASDHWLSREQVRTIVEVLESADRPILIHCEWGAERTGLVSAIATLLRPGSTLREARAQFSPWFLYIETKDGLVMSGHLDLYEAWLKRNGETHTADRFRRWLLDEYTPKEPSREYWRQNPYPRLVVTRPDGTGLTMDSTVTEFSAPEGRPSIVQGETLGTGRAENYPLPNPSGARKHRDASPAPRVSPWAIDGRPSGAEKKDDPSTHQEPRTAR